MTNDFYIPRLLVKQNKSNNEPEKQHEDSVVEMLNKPSQKVICVVILSEPGAGKTELLKSFAQELDSEIHYASILIDDECFPENEILIIDGLDEANTTNSGALKKLLTKVSRSNAKNIILSCRSAEWENNSNQSHMTRASKSEIEFLLFALNPFDYYEQEQFYNYQYYQRNFSDFIEAMESSNLYDVLGNPILLKIFSKAFNSGDTSFQSTTSIFTHAIVEFAKEYDENRSTKNQSIPVSKRIEYTEEIFTCLLSSGAVGVSVQEQNNSSSYPQLKELISCEYSNEVLNSNLFKQLAPEKEVFIPVHRIIAEFCTARYLNRKIEDKQNPILFSRLLSIIAPNKTVRSELRGMVGWLASLGSETVQQRLIEIDPYALIAYGDPAKLSPRSKQKLLEQLKILSEQDPLFRRNDNWRTLTTSNLINNDLVPLVKEYLRQDDLETHFKILLLELIHNSESKIIEQFINELQDNAINSSGYIRSLSCKSLVKIPNIIHWKTIEVLLAQNTNEALQDLLVMMKSIDELPDDKLLHQILEVARHITYRVRTDERRGKVIYADSIYFPQMIQGFSLSQVINSINYLLPLIELGNLENQYAPNSTLNGTSVILLLLLNRYLSLSATDIDHNFIWLSLKKICLSKSSNYGLERNIQDLLKWLENKNNREKVLIVAMVDSDFKDYYERDSRYSVFQHVDYEFVINYLFNINRADIWSQFYLIHVYKDGEVDKFCQNIRVLMRKQALNKPEFMKYWCNRERYRKLNRVRKKSWFERKWRNKDHQYAKDEEKQYQESLTDFGHHQQSIQEGRNLFWLKEIAYWYLDQHEKLQQYCDLKFAEEALSNGLEMQKNSLPTIEKILLSKIQNESLEINEWEIYAMGLAYFKQNNALNSLSKHISFILRNCIFYNRLASEFDEELIENYHIAIQKVFSLHMTLEVYFSLFYKKGGMSFVVKELIFQDEFNSVFAEHVSNWLRESIFFPMDNIYFEKIYEIFRSNYNDETVLELVNYKASEILAFADFSFVGPLTTEQREQIRFWLLRDFVLSPSLNDKKWNALKKLDNSMSLLNEYLYYRKNEENTDLSKGHISVVLDHFIDDIKYSRKHKAHGGGFMSIENRAYELVDKTIWKIDGLDAQNAYDLSLKYLNDGRFKALHTELKSINFNAQKRMAFNNFQSPSAYEVSKFFNNQSVITVGDLKIALVELLTDYQKNLNGSETNPKRKFYDKHSDEYKHVSENEARDRIVEDLKPLFKGIDASVNIESYMSDSNRCDITVDKIIHSKRSLLVIEVKGQWHRELFNAFDSQLKEKYMIHPDASYQGVYLVLWFGVNEKIAGKKRDDIQTPEALKEQIEAGIPDQLKNLVDVVVLDLSLNQ